MADDEPPIEIDFDSLTDDSGPAESGDNKFVCPHCDKAVKTQHGLNIHLSRMHGESTVKTDAKPSSLNARKTNLERELVGWFQFIGLTVSAVNQFDGQIIFARAEPLAKAWATLAKQNKAVEKALLSMMHTSAFGEVFMAMATIVIPIAANHDLIPKSMGMVFAPEQPEE